MNEKCKCGMSASVKSDGNYWCRPCYDRDMERKSLLLRLDKIVFMPRSPLTDLLVDIHVYLDSDK